MSYLRPSLHVATEAIAILIPTHDNDVPSFNLPLPRHTRILAEDGDNVALLSNTTAFKACFGAVLLLLLILHLGISVSFVLRRNKATLELSQPIALSMFVLSAAMATGGCYTLVSDSNIACILRQPILILAISLMGTILTGRSWRILSLIAPTLRIGKSQSRATLSRGAQGEAKRSNERSISMADQIQRAKFGAVKLLNGMSNFSVGNILLYLTQCKCLSQKAQDTNDNQNASSIRRIVPFQHMLRVIAILMIPQLILQVLNLSLPTMRGQRTIQRTESYSTLDAGVTVCESSTGSWSLALGIIFAALPFLLALLLNVSSPGVPDMFCEFDEIFYSIKTFLSVLSVAGPALALTEAPNAVTYLKAGIFLSLVLPLTWTIACSKLSPAHRRGRADKHTTKTVSGKFNSGINSSSLAHQLSRNNIGNSLERAALVGDSADVLKAADDALTLGKMYEQMGSADKALEVYDDALSLWKTNGTKKYVSYTVDEMNAFGPRDLQRAVLILTAKARCISTQYFHSRSRIEEAVNLLMEAFELFDNCPAKRLSKDGAFIFPTYSLISTIIDGGQATQEPAFEIELTRRFKSEACRQSFHYCRTMAMDAKVLAKNGAFEKALAQVDSMRSIYKTEMHTELIASEYGYDHCANIISLSAAWLYFIGRHEEAMNVCEEVVQIAPQMNERNVLGTTILLMPTILTLKRLNQVERAKELYNVHVCQHIDKYFGEGKKSPAKPLVRPILTLLTLCDSESHMYENLEADVLWMLDGSEKISAFTDNYFTKTCCSMKSLLAEICLQLSMRLDGDREDKKKLVQEGLCLSFMADKNTKDDDGKVIFQIAYDVHLPIMEQLESIANGLGIDVEAMRRT